MGEVVTIFIIVIMSLFTVLYMGSKIIKQHPSYFHSLINIITIHKKIRINPIDSSGSVEMSFKLQILAPCFAVPFL